MEELLHPTPYLDVYTYLYHNLKDVLASFYK